MMVEIELTGISEVRAKMSAISCPAVTDMVIDDAVCEGLTNLVSTTQATAVNWGRVKQSIMWGRNGPRDFWFGSENPVSAYLEWGTKPHFIQPRYKKALRFRVDMPFTGMKGRISHQVTKAKVQYGKGGSYKLLGKGDWYSSGSRSQNDVFAKFVRHPGTQPQPAIGPSLDVWCPTMPSLIGDRLLKLLKEA